MNPGNGIVHSMRIPKMSFPDFFPQHKDAWLMYSDYVSLSVPNTNVSTELVYNVGSLFKPDAVNAGHQPYPFDTCASIWGFYQVWRVQWEIEFFDPAQDGVYCYTQLTGTGSGGLAPNVISERPWVDCGVISNTGEQRLIFRGQAMLHDLIGVPAATYRGDPGTYGALVTAGPTNNAILRYGAATFNSTAVTQKVRIQLRFFASFWQRNSLSQS